MISVWMGDAKRYKIGGSISDYCVWWPASGGAGSSAWTQELRTGLSMDNGGCRWVQIRTGLYGDNGGCRRVKCCQALIEIFSEKGEVW